jgi:hypothetical protein
MNLTMSKHTEFNHSTGQWKIFGDDGWSRFKC